MELVFYKDYFNRFYEIVRNCQNNHEAYLKLEAEYYQKYNVHRYTSYNSFMNAKAAYIKGKFKKDRSQIY